MATQDTSVLPFSSSESSGVYVAVSCHTDICSDEYTEPAFIEAAKELKNKFILVAPDNFLAEYLPQHPRDMPTVDRDTFMNVAFMRSTQGTAANEQVWIEKIEEKDMHKPLVHLLLM
jgi:hypothetical protein